MPDRTVINSGTLPSQPLAASASSKPVAADSIRVRYRLVRCLLRSRQPAAGTAIRAREPAPAADWTWPPPWCAGHHGLAGTPAHGCGIAGRPDGSGFMMTVPLRGPRVSGQGIQ